MFYYEINSLQRQWISGPQNILSIQLQNHCRLNFVLSNLVRMHTESLIILTASCSSGNLVVSLCSWHGGHHYADDKGHFLMIYWNYRSISHSPPSITYQNGELLQKWIIAISQHQEIKFSDDFHVCSRHFEPFDIDKAAGVLKNDAVPVHFLGASNDQSPVYVREQVNSR